jgi:hypothetical protein
MERSIVVVTAAMVHYFRRPPHSISPRKEAARGEYPIILIDSGEEGARQPSSAALTKAAGAQVSALPVE